MVSRDPLDCAMQEEVLTLGKVALTKLCCWCNQARCIPLHLTNESPVCIVTNPRELHEFGLGMINIYTKMYVLQFYLV